MSYDNGLWGDIVAPTSSSILPLSAKKWFFCWYCPFRNDIETARYILKVTEGFI